MTCGVVLPPIVEAAKFGVPSTLIAKRALGDARRDKSAKISR